MSSESNLEESSQSTSFDIDDSLVGLIDSKISPLRRVINLLDLALIPTSINRRVEKCTAGTSTYLARQGAMILEGLRAGLYGTGIAYLAMQ